MPSTYHALLVALAAVIPGALYVLSFERAVGGSWGVNFSDRATRFLAVSVVLQVSAAPGTLYVARTYFVGDAAVARAELPLGLWLAAMVYVLAPIALGTIVGHGVNADARWARPLAGRAPQPRAWDFVWGSDTAATVRLRLKTGAWVGGLFAKAPDGRRPFAGGYPEGGDLYLPRTVVVDPDSGEFQVDGQGSPVILETAILVRWDEVEYLVLDS